MLCFAVPIEPSFESCEARPKHKCVVLHVLYPRKQRECEGDSSVLSCYDELCRLLPRAQGEKKGCREQEGGVNCGVCHRAYSLATCACLWCRLLLRRLVFSAPALDNVYCSSFKERNGMLELEGEMFYINQGPSAVLAAHRSGCKSKIFILL